MSKKNNHESKQKKSTRILALVLAALMVISVGTIAISLIVDTVFDTHSSDSHAGHNH